jgi:HD-like signal output (HDOD) protein
MTTVISTFENGKADFFALLSKRMSEKGDFPALSQSIRFLDESMQSDGSNVSEIISAILNDFTLTHKVIKLANSAMYYGMGGEVTTITNASVVLGMDAITHLALGVRFIDTLSSSAPDSEAARKELNKAILAGDIARNIVANLDMKNGEESIVCVLMHHLGRLLLVFYFPDEWIKIQGIAKGELSLENDAALQVIGVTIDEVAQEVAKDWRLPKKISDSMIRSVSDIDTSIPGSAEWLRNFASFAAEAAAKIVNENSQDNLNEVISRYDAVLQISSEDIAESVDLAMKMADEQVHSKIEHKQSEGKPKDSQDKLASGIREVSEMLVQGMDSGSMTSMILETMYASMGFNRVVVFFRISGKFKAKVGFGSMMPETLPQLNFTEDYVADVFHLSLANKADVFIQEMSEVKEASSIPVWLKDALPDVGAFILLPLVFNGRPVGLIYADWKTGAAGLVEPNELSSMGMLRDQLLNALAKKSK